MHDPNTGIMMSCVYCGKSFWCDDGDRVCTACYRTAPKCIYCGEIADSEGEHEGKVCTICEGIHRCDGCGFLFDEEKLTSVTEYNDILKRSVTYKYCDECNE